MENHHVQKNVLANAKLLLTGQCCMQKCSIPLTLLMQKCSITLEKADVETQKTTY